MRDVPADELRRVIASARAHAAAQRDEAQRLERELPALNQRLGAARLRQEHMQRPSTLLTEAARAAARRMAGAAADRALPMHERPGAGRRGRAGARRCPRRRARGRRRARSHRRVPHPDRSRRAGRRPRMALLARASASVNAMPRRRRDRTRPRGPLISVITPVYETRPGPPRGVPRLGRRPDVPQLGARARRRRLVESAAWARCWRRRRSAMPAVRVIRHDRNRGIVAASTTALEQPRGEYVAMLDHDDVLAPNALARLGNALRDHPEASFAYSDNDVLRRDGRLADPFFKPDFSPERLRNHNYVLHCVMAPLRRRARGRRLPAGLRRRPGPRSRCCGSPSSARLCTCRRCSTTGARLPRAWRRPRRQAVRVRGRRARRAGALRSRRHRRVGRRPAWPTACTACGARCRTTSCVSVVIPTRGTTRCGVGRRSRPGARGDAVDRRALDVRRTSSSSSSPTPTRPIDVVAGVAAIGGDATRIVTFDGDVQLLGEGQRRGRVPRPATCCCSSTTTPS